MKVVILEMLSDEQKKVVDSWGESVHHRFSDHAFNNPSDSRVYLPLEHAKHPHHIEIENHLKDHGFTVKDIHAGIATDKHGRDVKIGKILTRTGNKDMLNKYQSIKSNKENQDDDKHKDYHVVISRHPHDVAGMSSCDHAWSSVSCMRFETGTNKHYLRKDVEHGTHVAFLVHKDDHNIDKPLARIAIKPLEANISKHKILRPETRMYGGGPDRFLNTVKNWATKHFPATFPHHEDDSYTIHPELYNDSHIPEITHIRGAKRALAAKNYENLQQFSNNKELDEHIADHIKEHYSQEHYNDKSQYESNHAHIDRLKYYTYLGPKSVDALLNTPQHFEHAFDYPQHIQAHHIDKILASHRDTHYYLGYHPRASKHHYDFAFSKGVKSSVFNPFDSPHKTPDHERIMLRNTDLHFIKHAKSLNDNVTSEYLSSPYMDHYVRHGLMQNPNIGPKTTNKLVKMAYHDTEPHFIREFNPENKHLNEHAYDIMKFMHKYRLSDGDVYSNLFSPHRHKFIEEITEKGSKPANALLPLYSRDITNLEAKTLHHLIKTPNLYGVMLHAKNINDNHINEMKRHNMEHFSDAAHGVYDNTYGNPNDNKDAIRKLANHESDILDHFTKHGSHIGFFTRHAVSPATHNKIIDSHIKSPNGGINQYTLDALTRNKNLTPPTIDKLISNSNTTTSDLIHTHSDKITKKHIDHIVDNHTIIPYTVFSHPRFSSEHLDKLANVNPENYGLALEHANHTILTSSEVDKAIDRASNNKIIAVHGLRGLNRNHNLYTHLNLNQNQLMRMGDIFKKHDINGGINYMENIRHLKKHGRWDPNLESKEVKESAALTKKWSRKTTWK